MSAIQAAPPREIQFELKQLAGKRKRAWPFSGEGRPDERASAANKTLAEEGIAEDIDKLVEKLLGPA